MILIENMKYDDERALYGSEDLHLVGCEFDGSADGESALKESGNILVENCYFNLRYPLWHVNVLSVANSEMTEKCRAPLWYSSDIKIENCKMKSPKSLRECTKIGIFDTEISSDELGWSCSELEIKDSSVSGEYLFLRARDAHLENVTLSGKYSFQYVENVVIENSNFSTKDAFWHAKNVTVKKSTIKGEYLGWYSENLVLEDCLIIGTQPLCYCKGLELINCEMREADLSFEKSELEATLTAPIISIKNPKSGYVRLPMYEELIITEETSAQIELE